jgi:acetylornithine/succinyldiaminopimelate/putrescine aminotransferase
MLSSAHPAELPVYPRLAIELVAGEGSTVVAADGRRYLDLYGGHAVAVTGHCHPRVVEAVRSQLEQLMFYSNVVPLPSRKRLFDVLAELAPADLGQAFLVNSGAEANDVALQLARRVTGRRPVVVLEGGFHGRTLATLAASGMPHYRKLAEASGGSALVAETRIAPWDSPGALEELVNEQVAAVIVEPVQGLAGARDASVEALRTARAACDASGALLIFDEVQCGCGRTGAFTAAQSFGVTPDLLTLAKGIASGLPMGAVLMSQRIAERVSPGDLGSTFGGGPVPCAAAAASLEVLRDDRLPDRALRLESRLRQALQGCPQIERITGRGMMLGLVLDRPARPVQQALLDRAMLVGTASDPSVLRLLPPLVLADGEADAFVAALEEVLA